MIRNIQDTDLKQTRVFVAVVEHDGFSNAEAELNINCSSISKHISALETRLGVTLCHRGRGGFELTVEGEQFYQSAQSLLQSIDAHLIELSGLKATAPKSLLVGVVDSLAQSVSCNIPDLIRQYRQICPEIELQLEVLSPDEIITRLVDEELDFGITYITRRISGLDSLTLYQEKSSLYCANYITDDGLQRSFETLEQISHFPLATSAFDKSSKFLKMFDKTKICRHLDAVVFYTLSGSHMGFMPDDFAEYWVRQGKLKKVELSETSFSSEIKMLFLKNRRDKQPYSALVKLAKEIIN